MTDEDDLPEWVAEPTETLQDWIGNHFFQRNLTDDGVELTDARVPELLAKLRKEGWHGQITSRGSLMTPEWDVALERELSAGGSRYVGGTSEHGMWHALAIAAWQTRDETHQSMLVGVDRAAPGTKDQTVIHDTNGVPVAWALPCRRCHGEGIMHSLVCPRRTLWGNVQEVACCGHSNCGYRCDLCQGTGVQPVESSYGR